MGMTVVVEVLSPREALAIRLVHDELVTVDQRAEVFFAIASRNNLSPDFALKMAEAYVSGLLKLDALVREASAPHFRSLLRVIDGGKVDSEE
ncbi:MAG: hypothetical protein KGO96_10185 [Elusimicrobia bacterium]|nr:hypothetical protein [Elusimicrobiota bacterium]